MESKYLYRCVDKCKQEEYPLGDYICDYGKPMMLIPQWIIDSEQLHAMAANTLVRHEKQLEDNLSSIMSLVTITGKPE